MTLVVPQIVPGCSVNWRKSMPKRACTSTGPIHHSEAASVVSAARQAKPRTARHATPPSAGS